MNHGQKDFCYKKNSSKFDHQMAIFKNSLHKLVKPIKRVAVRARKSFCMPLSLLIISLLKKDQVLLVKLFYQDNNNSLAALHEYCRLKGLRKGPMLKNNLKKTIMKFEETGELGVLLEKGQKLVANEIFKELATTVVERTSSCSYYSASARSVSCELVIPWSTVRKIL